VESILFNSIDADFRINVDDLYKQTLQCLDAAFDDLFAQIGPPKLVHFGDEYAYYRYEEKSIHQAIIQKLARLVTGLQSIRLLNRCGLLQEQAVVQRTLDEFEQDIRFLSIAVIFDERTRLHERYLEAFYEEEFDNRLNAIESTQKRHTIPRKKIIAFLAKDRGTGKNQSSSIKVMTTLSKTYSGYVHGASPHLMELYYGDPPKFHLFGAKDSPLFEDHEADLINYFYRGILAFAFSANAFGNEHLHKKLHDYSKVFATASGQEAHLRHPTET